MPLPIGPFPYQLINGTLADANQVMADFNWLLNGVNSLPWPLPGSQIANYNKLLNPFMEIDQANEGAAVTVNAGIRTIDGFAAGVSATGGTWASGRTSGPPGYANSLYLQTGTAASAMPAGGYAQIYQQIEADDIQDTLFGTANAQPLTVSFWAQCSIASTYYLALYNTGATRSYLAPFTIATANTWQLITVTIPGDTAGTWTTQGNGVGLKIGWTVGSGTTYQGAPNAWTSANLIGGTGMSNAFVTTASAIFELGPCKLEVGSTATPMLRQSFQQELARCQRYYEKSYDPGVAIGTAKTAGSGSVVWVGGPNATGTTTGVALTTYFKSTKRAAPTFSYYSNAGAANGFTFTAAGGSWVEGGTFTVLSHPTNMIPLYNGTTNLTGISFDWVADARL